MGAARAGLKVIACVDIDARALNAHKQNFPESVHIEKDVKSFDSKQLLELSGLKDGKIEALIGGPPCQGFSRIGIRNPKDPRNSLFHHYLRMVAEIRPRFFLVENVPGILDDCFKTLRQRAFAQIDGYKIIGPIVLKASDFGAATNRERVFYVGYLSAFYSDISPEDFMASKKNREQINVQYALKGLKKSINLSYQEERQGWQLLLQKPKGKFWKKIFGHIPVGVGNCNAIEMLRKNNLVSGCLGTNHSPDVITRYSKLSEGDIDKPSRALRLIRKGVCPTLRAGTGPDHGSYQALRPIHPTEHRVITPREAARLQGFPDWFQFDPTKWHSFRQIGNSVSPILAEEIFKIILSKRKKLGV